MNRPFSLIYRVSALTLALLVALCGCSAAREEPEVLPEKGQPCHTAFTPEPTIIETDDTDYRALAEAVFEGIDAANVTDFTYESCDNGVRLLTYTGEGSTVVLPEQINGKNVFALGDDLFRDNIVLTALSIPDSVTEIGENLLTGCRSLQVLQTPQLSANRDDKDGHLSYFFGGETAIGTGFLVPSSLDTVMLSGTVTEIPTYAFYECARLRMVFNTSLIEHVGQFAFYGCTQLHTAELGIGTVGPRSIDDYAFGRCTSLTSFSQRGAVLGESVLFGCTKLRDVTLTCFDENIPHLGALFGAQTYMYNSFTVPSSLERVCVEEGNIPDYAFYGCDQLKLAILPSAQDQPITTIGVRAFWGCTALQKIELPDSVTSVSDLAFAHCTSLATVSFSESLTDLGIQTFMGCTNLTEITLPATLTSLPNSTFADCCNLQTVMLGSNLSKIGAQAFRNCVTLTTVTGGTSNMQIDAGNGHLKRCLA